MAIPSKVYILKIDDKQSEELARVAARSCVDMGYNFEYFQGYKGSSKKAWQEAKILSKLPKKLCKDKDDAAGCASIGHFAMWKKIAEGNDECVIILEHDGVLLHRADVEIPDKLIVVLGYKIADITKYRHNEAGPPKELKDLPGGHAGAHAYAITKKTAQILINEIIKHGEPMGVIDNSYFLKGRKTKVPISIMLPTPAVGWIRGTTIWKKPSYLNYKFDKSFSKFYPAKQEGQYYT
tara:strand:- start:21294 stop:22004 length:711 start_codon:yes stop_codon:yes gene_type:complete